MARKWAYPEAQVKEILLVAYQNAIPEGTPYKPEDMTEMTYASKKVPSNVGSVLSNSNRARIEVVINKMINCGCASARHDIKEAVRTLQFIKAGDAITQGAKDLLANAGSKMRVIYFKKKAE